MATALTPVIPKGPYPTLPVGAGGLTATEVAGDLAGNTFVPTGRELLIMHNTDGGAPHTVTITGPANDLKRTGDITTYSIAANLIAVFWFGSIKGWAGVAGTVLVTVSDVTVKLSVIRLP